MNKMRISTIFVLALCAFTVSANEVPAKKEIDIPKLLEVLTCSLKCAGGELSAFLNNFTVPFPIPIGPLTISELNVQGLFTLGDYTPEEGTLGFKWPKLNLNSPSYDLDIITIIKGNGSFNIDVHELIILIKLDSSGLKIEPHMSVVQMEISGLEVDGIDVSSLANSFVNQYLLDVIDIIDYIIEQVTQDPPTVPQSRGFEELTQCVTACIVGAGVELPKSVEAQLHQLIRLIRSFRD